MSGSTALTPDPKRRLQAGLTALKQGDYRGAIAALAAIALAPEDPVSAKAQMGLVVAYGKLGQIAQAVALCQALTSHADPQVRAWAEKTQSRFAASPEPTPPPDPPLDRTGFVPLEPPEPEPESLPASDDATGFVPLATAPPRRPGPPWPMAAGQGARLGRSPAPPPAPVAAAAEAMASPPESPYRPEWRQAGRAQRGQSLGQVARWPLWLVQVATAVGLFWMVQQLVFQPSHLYWQLVIKLPGLRISHAMGEPPVWGVLIGLGLLGAGSRWILDGLLTRVYGLRPLTLKQLATLSPEAGRSLARFCSQRRIPIPDLGLLPGPAPLAFSYGALPWITRTVVSQGLLDRLADDEIATIYAQEVGQISLGTVPLLSLVMVVAQIPYTLYWSIAQWGRAKTLPTSRLAATGGAALSYGTYALIRWMGLWAARSRAVWGDRIVAELTGNPNGYTRALLKLAIGFAATVQHQGQTSHLLAGFDLLLPLGLQSGITLGGLYPHTPLEPLLAWDYSSPYRAYLSLNQTHPPLGDRLYRLALYARRWQLDPELDFGPDFAGMNRRRQAGLTGSQWQTLLLQAAPFAGMGVGLVLAYGLLGLGTLGFRWRIDALQWMMGDRSLVQSLPLIGFSLGTFLRINPFFPDIVPSVNPTPAPLAAWLGRPDRLPVHSQPIQLQGKLLGRSGLDNTLSQDLWLHTPQGMVRLHSLSQWGPLGNLLPQGTALPALVNQEVVVTGWWRRGAVPWIDIETVRSRLGRVHTSQHPIWSTILAAIAALLGIYTIIQAGRF